MSEYLNRCHLQYYKVEVNFEAGKVFYIFSYKEVNLIALIKAKYKPQQKGIWSCRVGFLKITEKPHSWVLWDAEFFFSLCSDKMQCGNRLAFREKETGLVHFVGIVMLKTADALVYSVRFWKGNKFFYSFFSYRISSSIWAFYTWIALWVWKKTREGHIVPERCRAQHFLIKILCDFFLSVCFCCPVDKTNYNSFSFFIHYS